MNLPAPKTVACRRGATGLIVIAHSAAHAGHRSFVPAWLSKAQWTQLISHPVNGLVRRDYFSARPGPPFRRHGGGHEHPGGRPRTGSSYLARSSPRCFRRASRPRIAADVYYETAAVVILGWCCSAICLEARARRN